MYTFHTCCLKAVKECALRCCMPVQKLGVGDCFRRLLEKKRQLLERAGIFESLPSYVLDQMVSVAQPLHVDRGTVLQQQGASPDALYILTRGVCKVCSLLDITKFW